MIKQILKGLSFCFAIIFSTLLFTGCASKTYNFIGIVDEATNTIVLYENLDEEKKASVDNILGSNAHIKLSPDDTFSFSYVVVSGSMEITYKQTGTYKLNEKEKKITFYIPKADGSGNSELKQQFEDDKIIYYSSGLYLVFK